MTCLTVLAAGSLRTALTPLLAEYTRLTGQRVQAEYGPAGLLRQRIEAGAPCDLFPSPNTPHPPRLLAAGRILRVQPFIANRLCLTVRNTPATLGADWLALLGNPILIIGMSTPGCDPSGDYTWQLFDNIAPLLPPCAGVLKARARQLVGGADSPPLPAGAIAAGWLIHQGKADIFIGYAHYARLLGQDPLLRVVEIPAQFNVRALYSLGVGTAAAEPLAAYILSPAGQKQLLAAGFMPVIPELNPEVNAATAWAHQTTAPEGNNPGPGG
ncbi:substrate-binding domain-containing protein [Sodalis ligni]|uniref:substrate-binding domain-containing protein n=1 Tax=Sodalis ligni TaxID=2697027 RepID=UPI001BDDF3F4|nr:substrate-binding domain-containing protein [Sodalis ligni]QWA13259.1 substrate-binding domain-containing protein [Sodalis ligni]